MTTATNNMTNPAAPSLATVSRLSCGLCSGIDQIPKDKSRRGYVLVSLRHALPAMSLEAPVPVPD